MIIILLAFGLVIGFSAPSVFATEQTDQPKSEERAEKESAGSLKTIRAHGFLREKVSKLRKEKTKS